jgi:hypothetical protein
MVTAKTNPLPAARPVCNSLTVGGVRDRGNFKVKVVRLERLAAVVAGPSRGLEDQRQNLLLGSRDAGDEHSFSSQPAAGRQRA